MDKKNLTKKLFSFFVISIASNLSCTTVVFAQTGNPNIILDTNDVPVTPMCFMWHAVGDTFPKTWFYDTTGKVIRTNDIFRGKPVIFISGSYTCPGFRNNVKRINKETVKKAKTHDIYFVYIHEAHPKKGSPYGPQMDSFIVNNYDSIFMERQYSLGNRFENAKMTKQKLEVGSKILIDNEHNDFFLQLMSAPNGYMEFSADKILLDQRDWYFNKKQMRKLKKRRRKQAKMAKRMQRHQ
jgi:hypothetical protein